MSFLIKDVPTGKLNALVKKIGGLDVMDGVLDGTVEFSIVARRRLKLLGEVSLPRRSKEFDPHEFFRTRDGLWVSDFFRDHVLSVAKKTKAVRAQKGANFQLEDHSSDKEIRAEFPENHIFEDASAFCAHLAGMIERQWSGTEGDLISNGYANIFYVRGKDNEVFAVIVFWLVVRREWRVGAYRLGDDRWAAGDRAFSSNC